MSFGASSLEGAPPHKKKNGKAPIVLSALSIKPMKGVVETTPVRALETGSLR